MTTEANKALIRRYYEEVMNQRNAAIVDELYASDFIAHAPSGATSTLKDFKSTIAMSHAAIPDIAVIIEDQVAEGDKVVTHWRATGTHQGNFAGIPATGKHVTTSAIQINRIANGKIVELWEYFDMIGLLQQLGVFPPRG